MRIIEASRDQSDPVFGPRAGNQCVSNCIVYLHVVALKGVDSTLNRTTLDAILTAGASLDAIADTELKKKKSKPHPYRLPHEIPNVISTEFGATGHALSRAFNGTTETKDLGGYKCLGIHDFLIYASSKRRPLSIVITVGSLARALFLVDAGTYLFDPHATARCDRAAVYFCENAQETLELIVGSRGITDSFYYDATFTYFVALGPGDPILDIQTLVLKRYPDAELDIEPAIQSVPKTRRDPAPADRAARKRRSVTDSPRKRTKTIEASEIDFDPTTVLPSLRECETILRDFCRECVSGAPRGPPNCRWPIYGDTGLPFESAFLTDRVVQLVAQNIDAFAVTQSADANTNDAVPPDRLQHRKAMLKSLRGLTGLSEDIDTFIGSLQAHDLNLILLHNQYITPKEHLSELDLLLGAKMVNVFERRANAHREATITWLRQLSAEIGAAATKDIPKVATVFSTHRRLPVEDDFLCLRGPDKNATSEIIRGELGKIVKRYAELESVYRTAVENITDISIISRPVSGAPAARNRATPSGRGGKTSKDADRDLNAAVRDLERDDVQKLSHLTRDRFEEMYQQLRKALESIISTNFNNIVTGALPTGELQVFLEQTSNMNDTAARYVRNGLYRRDDANRFEQLLGSAHYLMTGETRTPDDTVEPDTRRLRELYTQATTQKETARIRLEEMLTNAEEKTVDPDTVKSTATLSMLHSQLEELKASDLSGVADGKKRLSAVTQKFSAMVREDAAAKNFVNTLSPENLATAAIESKTLARLQPVLREQKDLRAAYVRKLLNLLDAAANEMDDGGTTKEETLTNLATLIDKLPEDQTRTDLHLSWELIANLAKKVRATRIKSDDPTRALIDALSFFSARGTDIELLMSAGCGNRLPAVYEALKQELDNKVLHQREIAWKKYVKSLPDVRSQKELEAMCAQAPSETVLREELPALERKLEEFLKKAEAEREERERRTLTENKKKIASDLKRITAAIGSETPSAATTVDLRAICGLIELIGLGEAGELVEHFNATLSTAIESAMMKIRRTQDAALTAALIGNDPNPIVADLFPTEKSAGLKGALKHTSEQSSLLTAETKQAVSTAQNELRLLDALRTRWQDLDSALPESRYGPDYREYCVLKKLVDEGANAGRQRLQEQAKERTETMARSTTRADEKGKPLDRPDVLSRGAADRIEDIRSDVLKTHLRQQVKQAQTWIRDEADLLEGKIAAQARTHNETLESGEARWRAVIEEHRALQPPELDADSRKLSTEPLETCRTLLRHCCEKLPYAASETALKWLLKLEQALLSELRGGLKLQNGHTEADLLSWSTLATRTEDSILTVSTANETNAACEKIYEDVVREQGRDMAGKLDMLSRGLLELDPKRIVGGEPRYRALETFVEKGRNRLVLTEAYAKAANDYEELATSINRGAYGFDFLTMREKISALQQIFTELQKHYVSPDPHTQVTLPGGDHPDSSKLAPNNFIRGLAALEKHVTAQQTLLSTLANAQPIVHAPQDDVPVFLPPAEAREVIRARDDNTRLKFAPKLGTFYRVIDVFGEKPITDDRGVPISLTLGYGNLVYKHAALHPSMICLSGRDVDPKIVPSRHKATLVAAALGHTLRSFWSQIAEYDLRPLLTDDGATRAELRNEIYVLVNLKICVYALTIAWTVGEDSENEDDAINKGPEEPMPLLDFCTYLATARPQLFYGTLNNPLSVAIASLPGALDRQGLQDALTVTANPPPLDHRTHAFCIDPAKWREVGLDKFLWDSDTFKQLCPKNVGREGRETGKLLLYLLAIIVLPRDVAQCAWARFRPSYAKNTDTIFDFARSLFETFSGRLEIRERPVLSKEQESTLPTGERVLDRLNVREQSSETDDMLRTFLNNVEVLDYVLASYVFNIPMTFAIHIADLMSNRRRLLVRALENIRGDEDFENIVKSRVCNPTHLLDETWTGQLVEHSWFRLQLQHLCDKLKTYPRLNFVPLVTYSSDNSTKNKKVVILEPPELTDTGIRPPRFRVTNPFTSLGIDDDAPDMGEQLFSKIPLETDFLYKEPPPAKQCDTNAIEPPAGEHTENRGDPDFRIPIAPCPKSPLKKRSPDKFLSEDAVSQPIFVQKPIDRVIPVDEVTTFSPASTATNFEANPIKTLACSVEVAVSMLQALRIEIRTLAEDIEKTLRAFKIMYLY